MINVSMESLKGILDNFMEKNYCLVDFGIGKSDTLKMLKTSTD